MISRYEIQMELAKIEVEKIKLKREENMTPKLFGFPTMNLKFIKDGCPVMVRDFQIHASEVLPFLEISYHTLIPMEKGQPSGTGSFFEPIMDLKINDGGLEIYLGKLNNDQ